SGPPPPEPLRGFCPQSARVPRTETGRGVRACPVPADRTTADFAVKALRCSLAALVPLLAGVAAPALTAALRCDPQRLRRFGDPSVTGQFRPSKTEIEHEYKASLHHRRQRPEGLSPRDPGGDHDRSAAGTGAADPKRNAADEPAADSGLPD